MNTRAELFAAGTAILIIVLIIVATRVYLHQRSSVQAGLETLLSQLHPVNQELMSLVSCDHLSRVGGGPRHSPVCDLDPSDLWNFLGGLQGVEALEKNCITLIALAQYLQQWHPEALLVAEQLRLNAREMRWHLDRLRGAANNGNLRTAFPDYAERAVMTYYTMTRLVIALYESHEIPGIIELQRAI